MWDLKAVNNLEKDINASVAGDYLTLRVAVKHSSSLSLGKHRARVRQEATLSSVKLVLFCCARDKSPLLPLLYLALTCELAFACLLVSVHLNSQQGQGARPQQGQGAQP